MVASSKGTLVNRSQRFIANVITRSLDAVPRERRVSNDRLARATVLRGKNVAEQRQLSQVLGGSAKPLFEINPDIGFTKFSWPQSQLPLVKQAIKNTQQIKEMDSWEGKSYFRSMKSLEDYALDSPEMQLATSEEMLKSVARYLGKLPMLLDISARISLSDPDKPGSQLQGSQMFHRDMDDVASVKVWVLCSEVKSENGPTVLLPVKTSHVVAKEIGYKQGNKVPNDDPFAGYEDELFEAKGPIGTSFATDTCSAFHFGSRTQESKERLVLYFQYVTSTSVYFRPLGERAGNRRKRFFSIPESATLTPSQKILLRGYL